MKVAVLKASDPWLSRMLNRGVRSEFLGDQPVTAVVDVEQVDFLHHGPESNYRPYLHLRGRVAEFLPADQGVVFPFDAESLEFGIGTGDPVDVFYEFDRAQLVDLAQRGYFGEGFQPPAKFENVQWEFPGRADITVIYPETLDEDPVFFGGLRDANDMVLTQENSGYQMAEMFPEVSEEDEHQAQAREEFVRTRRSMAEDMFANIKLDVSRASAAREKALAQAMTKHEEAQQQGEAQTAPVSLFEQLMRQYEDSSQDKAEDRGKSAVDAALAETVQRHQDAVVEDENESTDWSAEGTDMFADVDFGVGDDTASTEQGQRRDSPSRASTPSRDRGPELG